MKNACSALTFFFNFLKIIFSFPFSLSRCICVWLLQCDCICFCVRVRSTNGRTLFFLMQPIFISYIFSYCCLPSSGCSSSCCCCLLLLLFFIVLLIHIYMYIFTIFFISLADNNNNNSKSKRSNNNRYRISCCTPSFILVCATQNRRLIPTYSIINNTKRFFENKNGPCNRNKEKKITGIVQYTMDVLHTVT